MILTTEGKVLFNETSNIVVKSNEAKNVMSFSRAKIAELSGGNNKNLVFFGEVNAGKSSSMRNTHHLVYHKELVLSKATPVVKYDLESNTISIRSEVFIKNLFIDLAGGKYIKLSDNYFDVVPGYPVTVKIDGDLKEIKGSLTFKSYRESYTGEKMDIQLEQ